MTYEFDLYPAATPLGTLLVTLGDNHLVAGSHYRHELLGAGKGGIVIDADSVEAQALDDEVYVVVRDTAQATQPIGSYFLTDHKAKVVSEGKERRLLEWSGEGALSIMRRGLLLPTFHAPSPPASPARGSSLYNIDRMWTWVDQKFGAIAKRGLEEGQYQPRTPLAAVTSDFDRSFTSSGAAWTIGDEFFQVRWGINILDLYVSFMRAGLVFQMGPGLLLRAFEPGQFGVNRSSLTFAANKARFEAGVNIMVDAERAGRALRVSDVLVLGIDNTYATVNDPTAPVGHWLRIDRGETSDLAALAVFGQAELNARKGKTVGGLKLPIMLGDAPLLGEYRPGPNGYPWVGDTVTADTGDSEHDYTDVALPLGAIEIILTEQEGWKAWAELGTPHASGGSSGACLCLTFAAAPVNPVLTDAFADGDDNPTPFGTRVAPEDVDPYLLLFAGSDQLQSLSVEWDPDGFGAPPMPAEAFTFLDRQAGADHHVEAWELVGPTPTAGVDSAVRVNSSDGRFAHAVLYFKGIGSSPSKTIAKASGTGTNPSVSVATTPGQLVYAAVSYHDHSAGQNATPITPGDDQTTIISARSGGTHSAGIHVTEQVADGSTTTATWTLGVSQQWTAIIIVLNDTAAGGVGSAPDTPTGAPGASPNPAHDDHSHPAPNAGLVSLVDTDGNFTGSTVEAALEALAEGAAGWAPTPYDHTATAPFVIAAHRGDIGSDDSYPENTLEAIRQAAIKGALAVEFDILRDADGTFQVIHDTTVDRTTDGTGAVSSKTTAQMAVLNIDGGFGYDAGRHGTTLNVPTAQQVIDALRAYDVLFLWDLKEASDAAHTALAELIVAYGLADRSEIRVESLTGAAAVKAVSRLIKCGAFTAVSSDPQNETNLDSWWARDTEVDSLAEVAGKAPDRVFVYVSVDDYASAETTTIANMHERGVRLVMSNHLVDALAQWFELMGAAAGVDVADLGDVELTVPVAGEMLRWDGTSWVNDAGLICVDPGAIVIDPAEPFGITLTSVWGIDSANVPYYDNANVTAGDEAALFFDPLTGEYTLIAYDF